MSVWQTPQAWRRTSTSPGPGPSRSTSWTTSGWANSSRTAARIFMAPTLTPKPACPPGGASTVQRGLLLGVGKRPGGGRAALLAEVEAHLARRPQALGMVGTERGTRGVQRQGAEHVAA